MSKTPLIRRGLAAIAVALVVLAASPSAGARETEGGTEGETDVVSQHRVLPAPFVCGSEWQGTTYPGHGSHNWNLDLNRADPDLGTDLGQPLLAQAEGTVVWAHQTGFNNGAGTYIEIDYGDVTARYLHLIEGSIPDELAQLGADVEAGQFIGYLGATGRTSHPHLHLEYWDSTGFDGSPWWELPPENHLPVVFDGHDMIATPGRPTTVARSTNCPTLSLDGAPAERRDRTVARDRGRAVR